PNRKERPPRDVCREAASTPDPARPEAPRVGLAVDLSEKSPLLLSRAVWRKLSEPPGPSDEPLHKANSDRARRLKSRCLANEHQESHLEGILGIVRIPQHPAANPKDHRPMPAHHSLDCGLIALFHISSQ